MRRWTWWILAMTVAGCPGGVGLEGDGGDEAEASGDGAADVAADVAEARDGAADPGSDPGPDDGADDGTDDECRAQDVRAVDPLCGARGRIAWDGRHCVDFPGCGCEGADCDAVYDTMTECVAARRGCYAATCGPHAVWDDRCDWCEPDAADLLGVFWDGRECFELWGCSACVGAGCAAAFASLGECAAVQAECAGARCATSGGDWFPAAAGFCDFACGVPSDDDCEADACDCGPGRTFVAGEGCRADPGCGPAELCRATGGDWYPEEECYCGFTCGRAHSCGPCVEPSPCACCPCGLDSCDCGPHRRFDETAGCVPDASCGAAPETICGATGGTWRIPDEAGPCWCGHWICGRPDPLAPPCCSAGCDCGPLGVFDPDRGCRRDDRCVLRAESEPCVGHGAAGPSCRPGLVCCEGCGVPPGCPTCRAPCCPDNPGCAADGCFPPPP